MRLNQINKYQALWEYSHGVSEVESTPSDLQIGRTNTCNFKCVYCGDHREGNQVPRTNIEGHTLDDMLTLIPRSTQLMFHGISEFMIDPHFFDILQRCADAGAALCINTNGSVCTAKHVKALCDYPGPLTLVISVDAATPEVFSHIRGWHFWRVIKNIKRYVDSFRDQRKASTFITLSFVITKSSVCDVVPFVYLAKSLGVDSIRYYRLHEYDGLDWQVRTQIGRMFDYREECTEKFVDEYNRRIDEAAKAAALIGLSIEVPAKFESGTEGMQN